jgi:hypothetical protein
MKIYYRKNPYPQPRLFQPEIPGQQSPADNQGYKVYVNESSEAKYPVTVEEKDIVFSTGAAAQCLYFDFE